MKIIVTAQGNTLDAQVDPRFGRAKYFIIYDLDNDTFKIKDNVQNLNAAQGAGIQAAMNVAEEKPEAVVTGHCGPKAFRVLNESNIKIALGASGTVKEAVESYKTNKLKISDSPDVEGHWV